MLRHRLEDFHRRMWRSRIGKGCQRCTQKGRGKIDMDMDGGEFECHGRDSTRERGESWLREEREAD
jgi:hypothetical protein